MPGVRIIETTAAQWGVPPGLPGVLRSPGAVHAPEQEAGGRDAGSDRSLSGRAWPGSDFGARRPGTGETPLSADEVWHGVQRGLIP